MSFQSLGLDAELLDAVVSKGYDQATPIQQKAIPAILEGRDLLGGSQTGTGKTAAFTLPILQLLSKGRAGKHPRVLILAPTRELAAQVGESVATYGRNVDIKSTIVFGGVGINPQKSKLRAGIDVLIACPGRLLDLHSQGAVNLGHIEILVLDEADRMLDMGFIHDIKRIIRLMPDRRQNLLFSATYSKEIRQLADGLLHDPVQIEVTPRNSTVEKVEQIVHPVAKARKRDLLKHLIERDEWSQVLVFARTRHGAERLAKQLDRGGIPAAAIHGDKSQGARTRNLANFKANKIRVLVATDIAARGLDIKLLPHVVNFDLPNVSEDYVHRIGRTGRAGAGGLAVSLVSAEEGKLLADIEKMLGDKLKVKEVKGFEGEVLLRNPPKKTARPSRRPQGSGGGDPNKRGRSGGGRRRGGRGGSGGGRGGSGGRGRGGNRGRRD